jgi:uncharacterized protein
VILGFIGAGGAGLLLALLTSVFHLPIHQAIGTALAAMCFVTVSGAISHYREGNVAPRVGIIVGVSGMLGAVVGAVLSRGVPEEILKVGAGLALWGLAFLVWVRTRVGPQLVATATEPDIREPMPRELAASVGLGLSGGASAAFFGVGMAPFLQLGFLSVLKLSLRQTIGTTMLTLVFISGAASAVLARGGDVSLRHLVGAVIGLSIGTFIGARFTKRAPRVVLRVTVVAVPVTAGAMLLFL